MKEAHNSCLSLLHLKIRIVNEKKKQKTDVPKAP